MTKRIMLLDFDGCLANTWQMLALLLLKVSQQQGIDHHLNLSQAVKIVQRHQSIVTGTWQLMNEMKIPMVKRIMVLNKVNQEFNYLVKANTNYQGITWELFSDALPTVVKLHQQGYLIAVVSEHKLSRLTQFLTERKVMKYLDLGIFSAKQKLRVLKKLVKTYPHQEIYYLADRITDVADARKVGIVPISITRGLSAKAALEKVNPGMVVDQLDQALKLIKVNRKHY